MLKRIWLFILKLLGLQKNKEDDVPEGLEVRNSKGSIVVQTTSRLSIIVDRVEVRSESGQVSVSNDLFLTNDVYVLTNAQPKNEYTVPLYSYEIKGSECVINFTNIGLRTDASTLFIIGVIS